MTDFNIHRYDDIINMAHHVSVNHAQMSMTDRAAQFAPFAALTGYDDAVRETARQTDKKAELSENMIEILNSKMQIMQENIDSHPEITVTYFKPDERKEGGKYITVTGNLVKIDSFERVIEITDEIKIEIDAVSDIQGELFGMAEDCGEY